MMSKYICPSCYRHFNRKFNYERHIEKKNKCAPKVVPKPSHFCPKLSQKQVFTSQNEKVEKNDETNHDCKFCFRKYKHRQHLTRHLKICGLKKAKEELEDEEKSNRCDYCFNIYKQKSHLSRHLKDCIKKLKNDGEVAQLRKEISEIKKQLETKTSQTINNITNNTNINIILNDYGKEDMTFLKSSQKYARLLSTFLENGMGGLQKYIQYKYCNPEKPENLTIKYTNKRHPEIQVRNANKWEVRNKHEVIDEIYDKDMNVEELLNIYENINELGDDDDLDQIQEKFLEKITEFYEKEENSELDQLKKSTLDEFYNCYKEHKEKFS